MLHGKMQKETRKSSLAFGTSLASYPGPLRGEERAWYTLCAHALFSQQKLGIRIFVRLLLRKRDP